MPDTFEKVVTAHTEPINILPGKGEKPDIGFTLELNTLAVFANGPCYMLRSQITDIHGLEESRLNIKNRYQSKH
jgi:hypothetical protein